MNVPHLSKQSCVSCRSYIDDGNRTASGTHIMLRPELFCVCEDTSSFSLVTIMRHTCVNQSIYCPRNNIWFCSIDVFLMPHWFFYESFCVKPAVMVRKSEWMLQMHCDNSTTVNLKLIYLPYFTLT